MKHRIGLSTGMSALRLTDLLRRHIQHWLIMVFSRLK
jgi:hypothetical protein